ncbi:MAG: hypothetical protein KVP17_004150 [Porospora cf. gigantea B]|nr:MAG: hypothetical protein KVP17_004150 [Porospora cf. gigantea B]
MNPPTLIDKGRLRFFICDCPNDDNLSQYLEQMNQLNVTDLVRTCEPTYDKAAVEAAGINVHEIIFRDGEAPSDQKVDEWLEIVKHVSSSDGVVAVHCVAGLGRAPLMVAIALIEFEKFDPLDAVQYLRDRRRGAINRKQLAFLRTYKPRLKQHSSCFACLKKK